DISLQQVGLYTIATDVSRTLLDGTQPKRFDRKAPDNPLFNTYPTRDGKWVMLVHMTPDPYWPRLCRALGCEEWSDDPGYATMAARRARGAEIAAYIEGRMLEADLAEWSARLDEAGLIWAPMVEVPEVVQDPQLRLRGAFQPLVTERGTFETVGVPFVIRDADMGVRGMASGAGADTAEVLAWAGFSADEVAELAAGGALG
ncbi:MAG TPA: CoA transferase, partial [Tepidiformaceae bacterium]|nr:CoA transferase [Tepidiformaceae bacterium]